MQLKRPNFRHHAREFRFTGNFANQFLAIYLGVFEHDRRTLRAVGPGEPAAERS